MIERLIITFHESGAIHGIATRDRGGKSVPATVEDLAAIAPAINTATLAEIDRLKQEIADMQTRPAEAIAAMQATEAGQQDRYAALAEIYNTLLPEEQVAFSGELVVILGLMDRGREDLAAARLSMVQVPEHLAEKKAAMIAAIQPGA